MHTIQWSLNIQIAGGLRLATSKSIEVDAYDSIKVDVESSPSLEVEVELLPGISAGQVKALIITSDRYGNEVTYKVNNSTSAPIALNQPLALMGEGAVGLLDSTPERLFFSNTLPDPVTIEIIIGRDATPSP